MAGDDAVDIEAMRSLLLEERESLLRASAATAEDRAPVELDQQAVGRLSRLDAIQVRAMAEASETRRQGRLHRIDAALKRIDDGSYGECMECGESIPPRRLEIDPTVAVCVPCAG
ncbi:MAG: TraR/DksA C4-type zinc finger protein [Defluviicoccus sp.]|nr:TraR/DksA C4-type zinc finger protein [Defluviicoccus sp.]